jgi:uncharacterized DUF497 family protein
VEVEWDGRKARENLRKHGIDFVDAILVLHDSLAITIADDSEGEERSVTIGADAFRRILVVVHVWRREGIRLISARHATRRERRIYLEGK